MQDPPKFPPQKVENFSELKELFVLFRDYMKHEDDLINHRSTWHGTMQGLLFTSFGVLLGWERKGLDVHRIHTALLFIVPLLGIMIAYFACKSCQAAHGAIKALEDQWHAILRHCACSHANLPGIVGGGSGFARRWGKYPSIWIPVFVALAWGVVLGAVVLSYPYAESSKTQSSSSSQPPSTITSNACTASAPSVTNVPPPPQAKK